MIPTETLVELATLGLSRDQAEAISKMLRAVEDATRAESASAIEARRANDRERKQRQRENVHGKSRDITGQDVTGVTQPASRVREDIIPARADGNRTIPSLRSGMDIIPPQVPQGGRSARTSPEGFGEFWRIWPHKVGRPAAERAFARHPAAELPAILAGVERYVSTKPPDRPWLNPATFLNQRRWEDAPAAEPRAGPSGRQDGLAVLWNEMRGYGGNGQANSFDGNVLGLSVIPADPGSSADDDGGLFGEAANLPF